jgi:3-oxoadipate enol-lactonase
VTDLAYSRAGSGRPFLWGHGLTSSRANEARRNLFDWTPLAANGIEVIRYDARGHGESPGPADAAAYRWPNLALDLLALADDLGLGQLSAGGASMGCATVLHAAVRAPERFDRLVLVIPPTGWETRPDQAKLYELSAAFVESQGKDGWMQVAEAAPKPAIFDNDPTMTFEADIEEAILPSVMRGAAASDLPAPDAIVTIRQPALVLAWDTDPGHPVSTAERLTELLPNADLHVARSMAEVRAWPDRVASFLS